MPSSGEHGIEWPGVATVRLLPNHGSPLAAFGWWSGYRFSNVSAVKVIPTVSSSN